MPFLSIFLLVGTYKAVPKVDWLALLQHDFGHPDWAVLYPLNSRDQAKGMLTPRMACKLFHDGVYIIRKGEESAKFVQDLLPDIAHKKLGVDSEQSKISSEITESPYVGL